MTGGSVLEPEELEQALDSAEASLAATAPTLHFL